MKLNLFLATGLFTFASTVSSTITLSRNFSPFPILPPNSPKAPPLCTSLYASPISQCSPATDFLNDAYCTPLCVKGLKVIEEKLNEVCDSILAPKDSVLGRVFEGKLVESLCKDGDQSGTESSSEIETLTVTTPTSTTNLKSTVSTVTTSKEEQTSTVVATTETSTSITLLTSTTTSAVSTRTDDTATPTPTETRSYRERMRDEQVMAIAAGGGGSPYDNIYAPRVQGGGGRVSESCNIVSVLVFAAMAVDLLGRGV